MAPLPDRVASLPAEERLDRRVQLGDELVVERLGYEHVVGGDAGLAGFRRGADRLAGGLRFLAGQRRSDILHVLLGHRHRMRMHGGVVAILAGVLLERGLVSQEDDQHQYRFLDIVDRTEERGHDHRGDKPVEPRVGDVEPVGGLHHPEQRRIYQK